MLSHTFTLNSNDYHLGTEVLIAFGKNGLGRKYALSDPCTIGRHSDCEIQIVDSQMSNLGLNAVRICLDALANRSPSKNTVLSPQLIIREST